MVAVACNKVPIDYVGEDRLSKSEQDIFIYSKS